MQQHACTHAHLLLEVVNIIAGIVHVLQCHLDAWIDLKCSSVVWESVTQPYGNRDSYSQLQVGNKGRVGA
jgi:hypothetical protein